MAVSSTHHLPLGFLARQEHGDEKVRAAFRHLGDGLLLPTDERKALYDNLASQIKVLGTNRTGSLTITAGTVAPLTEYNPVVRAICTLCQSIWAFFSGLQIQGDAYVRTIDLRTATADDVEAILADPNARETIERGCLQEYDKQLVRYTLKVDGKRFTDSSALQAYLREKCGGLNREYITALLSLNETSGSAALTDLMGRHGDIETGFIFQPQYKASVAYDTGSKKVQTSEVYTVSRYAQDEGMRRITAIRLNYGIDLSTMKARGSIEHAPYEFPDS